MIFVIILSMLLVLCTLFSCIFFGKFVIQKLLPPKCGHFLQLWFFPSMSLSLYSYKPTYLILHPKLQARSTQNLKKSTLKFFSSENVECSIPPLLTFNVILSICPIFHYIILCKYFLWYFNCQYKCCRWQDQAPSAGKYYQHYYWKYFPFHIFNYKF